MGYTKLKMLKLRFFTKKEISKNFLFMKVVHIPREMNKRADELCNISFKTNKFK